MAGPAEFVNDAPSAAAPNRGSAGGDAPSRAGLQRSLRYALLASATLFAAGCRHVDNVQTDLLERELRQQEDYIYELENYVMEYSEKLRQARMMCQAVEVSSSPSAASPTTKRPKTIKAELAEDERPVRSVDAPASDAASTRTREEAAEQSPAASPADEEPQPPAAESLPVPGEDLPGDEAPQAAPIDPQQLEAPELEIGPSADARGSGRSNRLADSVSPHELPSAAAADAGQAGPLLIPDPADYAMEGESQERLEPIAAVEPAGVLASPPENRLVARQLQVTRLFVERSPKDASIQGLLAVVEAQSDAGEPVDVTGSVSMMVMAGDQAGALARVRRWDFTPEETQAAWQSTPLGDGLHLELPVEAGELPEGPIEIWARVVDASGQKLLARLPFDVESLATLDDVPMDAPPEPADEAPSQLAQSVRPSSHEEAAAPAKAQWRRASHSTVDRREGFASTEQSAGKWTAQRSSATTAR
jgi:hypothetical protein